MFSETWGASGEQRLGQFGREDSTDDAQISGWDSSGGQIPGPSPPDRRTAEGRRSRICILNCYLS